MCWSFSVLVVKTSTDRLSWYEQDEIALRGDESFTNTPEGTFRYLSLRLFSFCMGTGVPQIVSKYLRCL